jgi:hypothetical protein
MWGLSLGVVLTENDVNLGDALCSEVERFNLLWRHAKKTSVSRASDCCFMRTARSSLRSRSFCGSSLDIWFLGVHQIAQETNARMSTAEGCVTRLSEYSRVLDWRAAHSGRGLLPEISMKIAIHAGRPLYT